jgi:MYXO-CTERM domain-containing protein
MRGKTLVIAAALIGPLSLPAQIVLVQWSFGTSSPDAPTTAATYNATNITGGAFSYLAPTGSTGGTNKTSPMDPADGGYFFKGNYWRTSDNDYFSFSVTPSAGYQLSITSISFDYASSSTGPSYYSLAWSADTFSTTLANGTLTNAPAAIVSSDWHTATPSLNLTTTDAITFRLYATGASTSTGVLEVDRIQINGTITSMPEPSVYGAAAGLSALAWAFVRRRRQVSNRAGRF